MMSENTSRLTKYEDITPLNEGHGVFLVRDKETGRICVKKIQQTYNPDVYKRLYSSKIKGIPEIHEMSEENGILTIIEEYISGDTIEGILKRKGAFSEETVKVIAVKLCDILDSLHSLCPPVVHRDIKPSNAIITSYGEVFLVDLNAAKLEDNKKAEDTVLLGTYGYAAPEQYGFGTSTVQTDIYALGMLMNTMIKGEYSKEIIKDGGLSKIIQKCVMLRPEDRFSSVKELKESLTGSVIKEKNKLIPPGFRSGNPVHMGTAIIGYSAVIFFSLAIKSNIETSGFFNWFERIFFILILTMIIFFSANYMGLQAKIPLCRSRNPVVKILGIVLFDAVMFVVMIIIMLLIEMAIVSAMGG